MREIHNVPRLPPGLLLSTWCQTKPELLLTPSLSFLPAHFSRINLFRSGKVAVTTTQSRAKALRGDWRECRKRGEEKSQVIYSPLKEPQPQGQSEWGIHPPPSHLPSPAQVRSALPLLRSIPSPHKWSNPAIWKGWLDSFVA